MSNFIDKIKNKMDELKEVVVSDEVHKERLDICYSCEHLFKPTKQCKKCGCFVFAKSKISSEQCPELKWSVVTVHRGEKN